MFRDLLSNRWFQGGLAFFVLVVGGSLLYSWHTLRTTESDMEGHDRLLGQQKQKETRTAQEVNVPTENETPGLVNTPDENTDTQMPDTTEALPNETENLDLVDAFLPEYIATEEAPAEDVPVSPFGFGPYPEVPADYPFTPFWLRPPPKGNKPREILMRKELLSRVMVKAWTEGDHNFIGAGTDGGKVYLTYPNVMYVKYGEPYENKDGVLIRPITEMESDGVLLSPEDARNGVTPAGYQVIEFDDAGYDPYTYLDLP